MRESARICDVRMAQFVLKIEKLSHIIGARESRDLRSPSPIMAPDVYLIVGQWIMLVAGSLRRVHQKTRNPITVPGNLF